MPLINPGDILVCKSLNFPMTAISYTAPTCYCSYFHPTTKQSVFYEFHQNLLLKASVINNNAELNEGDLVMLKSGGPCMVINNGGNPRNCLLWWDLAPEGKPLTFDHDFSLLWKLTPVV
jgi:hypothetical protein